ncbi:hypothetical protein CEXT_743981 [Caerostris extrusa]|uniref:Uncharacterized protein n=1 Tax=Caerostris extrusa TaxID=172846 RepID=A0AAV4QRL6_CAEEX|nr:hypothetical protein CEXT_743981 [Caerostris extrusa]
MSQRAQDSVENEHSPEVPKIENLQQGSPRIQSAKHKAKLTGTCSKGHSGDSAAFQYQSALPHLRLLAHTFRACLWGIKDLIPRGTHSAFGLNPYFSTKRFTIANWQWTSSIVKTLLCSLE